MFNVKETFQFWYIVSHISAKACNSALELGQNILRCIYLQVPNEKWLYNYEHIEIIIECFIETYEQRLKDI